MKLHRILLAAILVFFAGVETSAQNTSLEEIDKGWSTKTINNVANGSLATMLERFDQTWPTWMCNAIRKTMKKGLSTEVLDKETALTVTVDTKNGFVSLGDGGTDGEYLSACYWNRSNGHKLLAVLLGSPTDPCIEVLCTYDYDPQTKVLRPEPDILKGYRWGQRGNNQVFVTLPHSGKNVEVRDWTDEGPVLHLFTWDGMKPVYEKSEPLYMDEEPNYDVTVEFKGTSPNIKDFVSTLIKRAEEMDESLSELKDSWEMFLNGMKLMPGETLTVDTQNGYMHFESELTETDRLVIECCYWNFADGKRKLVALTHDLYSNGKPMEGQFSGIEFFLYDNETHQLGWDHIRVGGHAHVTHTGTTGIGCNGLRDNGMLHGIEHRVLIVLSQRRER